MEPPKADAWLDLGPLEDIPEGRPVLRKAGGQRFACVRANGSVHAVDDRCPHQGYPLSQGEVRDGVLTCQWHNWKFELGSGECLFGGEAVRRYPTRIESGRVHLNPAIDAGREAARLRAGLAEALRRDEPDRALREALRLGEFVKCLDEGALGRLAVGFEALARDGAERAEYGFDHGLAAFADLVTWVGRGWVGAEEAFVAASHAIAEPSRRLPPRRPPGAAVPPPPDDALDPARVGEALAAERRDEAEARVRAIVRANGAGAALGALVPFIARHLFDYGHSVIFTAKAAEIAARFPALAEEVFGALTASLAWATADTSLPPFTATREALARLDETPEQPASAPSFGREERAAYERAVLSGERAAARATLEALGRGASAERLLRATAHAAAVRLAHFDDTWERRVDAEVGVLDVTHAVTFAEGALSLIPAAGARDAARLALIAAAFVGKLKNAERADPGDPAPHSSAPDLASALAARDPGRALAIARAMGPDERRGAYATIAPFAAFEAATRPIFYAHTIKTAEALARLERDDPSADGAYLRALLAYVTPTRPEMRARRVAAVARKFLADGRPPEGLYLGSFRGRPGPTAL